MIRASELPAALQRFAIVRRRRMIAYAVVGVILAALTVLPPPYIGRARILPRDPSTALGSISAAGGRLPDIGALLGGGGRAIDLYLAVAQSADIRNEVIQKLHLAGPDGYYATPEKASIHLEKVVDVASLPGSILQVEAKTHDADEALRLTTAFTDAIARHLREINTQQTSVKQALLQSRFGDAAARLARAQSALNEFRRANRLSAAPEAELGGAIALKSGLEAQLQAKQVELKAMQDVLGPDNVRLRETETEIEGLRAQLSRNLQPSDTAAGPNAGGLTELSTQYLDRYRDYLFAQSIYEVYTRLAEQVAVEDLSGRDAPTVQFIEAPHIEPGRHYNIWAVASLCLVAVFALFVELYAPATGIDIWGAPERDILP